jgi:uncharacterized repeat protein (TIGR03803 family)
MGPSPAFNTFFFLFRRTDRQPLKSSLTARPPRKLHPYRVQRERVADSRPPWANELVRDYRRADWFGLRVPSSLAAIKLDQGDLYPLSKACFFSSSGRTRTAKGGNVKSRRLLLIAVMTFLATLAIPVRLPAQAQPLDEKEIRSFIQLAPNKCSPRGHPCSPPLAGFGGCCQGLVCTFVGGSTRAGDFCELKSGEPNPGPSPTFTTLVNFEGTNGDYPNGIALVQGFDGNFYGTTYAGGANNDGTVFTITSGGTLTTLHSFDGTDGAKP